MFENSNKNKGNFSENVKYQNKREKPILNLSKRNSPKKKVTAIGDSMIKLFNDERMRKLVKYVRDLDKDNKVNIGFSSVISRSDKNLGQKKRDLNLKLKRYCEGNSLLFVDNVNVEGICLNNSKLHLNHKETNILCQNIKTAIYHYRSSTKNREIDITNLSLSKYINQILFDLKSNNPSNLSFTYLDINLVRNKFENFKGIINGNVDIFTVAETKLNGFYPTSQFELEGYHSLFHLDITKQSGRFLLNIKSSIPSRQLSYGSIFEYLQAMTFEINLRQEKWLMISICCPPSQGSGFFIHFLTKIVDHFATMIITLLWGILICSQIILCLRVF